MMLNQNLLKGVFSPSRATPSTSFEEDYALEELERHCYELIIPKYPQETQTKTEDTTTTSSTTSTTTPTSTQIPQPKPRRRVRGQSFTPEYYRSTKNVAKNYGKAIASFACSELAVPYLEKILGKEDCTPAEFMEYIRKNKELIQGIDSFRAMLLPKDDEDLKEIVFKRAFQQMSEVFIKCFSVNWICHGKMKDKLIYLKFRFKILRRIRSPELFTYLKKPKKKTQQHL